MFDKFMLVDGSLRRSDSGFEVDVRIPYYRGVALSLIEGLELTLDGQAVPREAIRFALRGEERTQDEIADDARTRWEFGEVATLRAEWRDGLAAGEHVVEQATQLRISYLPTPLRGHDRKTMEVA
jgi:hypothetical protein